MPASVYGQLILTPSRGYWCVGKLNTLSFSAGVPISKKISQSPPRLRQRQAALSCRITQLFLWIQVAGTCSLKPSLVPRQRAQSLSSLFQCPCDGHQSSQAYFSAHMMGTRAHKPSPVSIRTGTRAHGLIPVPTWRAPKLTSLFQCPFNGYQNPQAYSSVHSMGTADFR